jgi:hypothetical protein
VELFIAGDHPPTIPSIDVVGRGGIVAPEQYGPTGSKFGVTRLLTMIVPVAFTVPQPPVRRIL